MSKFETVFTKSRKRGDHVFPATKTEFEACVVKGTQIEIRNVLKGQSNTFKLGQMAEYDSYNLSYYGPIVAITAKRITIVSRHDVTRHESGEKVKKHSLDLNEFSWRNINFDLNETMSENADTMNYI